MSGGITPRVITLACFGSEKARVEGNPSKSKVQRREG
jgi:hypothetical protein